MSPFWKETPKSDDPDEAVKRAVLLSLGVNTHVLYAFLVEHGRKKGYTDKKFEEWLKNDVKLGEALKSVEVGFLKAAVDYELFH